METPLCLPSPLPSSLPPHCGGLRIQATREIGCGASEGQTESKGKGKASKVKTLDLVDLQKHYLFLTWGGNSCASTGDPFKPQDWS